MIQETTPLAGSSAGAVVCVVIASGKTMQEALMATKILAEDCRLKGTAFRLGVLFYTSTDFVFVFWYFTIRLNQISLLFFIWSLCDA